MGKHSSYKSSMSLYPDKVFGLYFPGNPPGEESAYFFLEADRSTMPIQRRNMSRSDLARL